MYADLICVEVLIREFKSASADPHVKPVLWIRIQDLMTQNWKNAEETKIYFLWKIAIYGYWILSLFKRTSKLQKHSALKREHPALQKIKFINFFPYLWVNFAFLGPYPGTPLNSDLIRILI
jgi:hypothetical protein